MTADLGLRELAAVAAGSAAGALARRVLALWLAGPDPAALPVATLLANALGSFLIGLYVALTLPGGPLERAGRVAGLFVTAGFCGGFTTFSIFSLEVLDLLRAGALPLAGIYMALSLATALGGVWAGHRAGLTACRRGS